jgi:DNA modification methylase
MAKLRPVTIRPGIGDNRPSATLYYGQDVRETLRSLPEASIHTVCTSPPYFGLRDYGVDGQIGLEPTPEEFVAELVEVFREVKRVLRPDGTLWVNLGDSYTSGGRTYRAPDAKDSKDGRVTGSFRPETPEGLKPKDLIGIPWRVAFALQADGWYLRSDIIWAKGSCMPESVTDRPTKAHEYVFLFAHPDSGGKYYYDAEAVKETIADTSISRLSQDVDRQVGTTRANGGRKINGNFKAVGNLTTGLRNRRSVWNVNPKPYTGAHFATWPPDLVRPMVLAGTSSHGVCSTCGAPWTRITDFYQGSPDLTQRTTSHYDTKERYGAGNGGNGGFDALAARMRQGTHYRHTVGWEPSCDCNDAHRVPATVLDPFSGSATTGMVALQEGRNYIGTDLNPNYLPMAESRVREERPPAPSPESDDDDVLGLFGGAD